MDPQGSKSCFAGLIDDHRITTWYQGVGTARYSHYRYSDSSELH